MSRVILDDYGSGYSSPLAIFDTKERQGDDTQRAPMLRSPGAAA